ncbi:MAG: hypothetical protein H2174_01485 [Vampirovibrio sp.]|nr:hypothetical protein [Vampirovibrio sp.]
MTMPQVSLPPSATNLGLQSQLDPNSALAQSLQARSSTLASMSALIQPSLSSQGLQSQLDPNSALAQSLQAQSGTLASINSSLMPQSVGSTLSQPPSAGSVLTPDVLKRYIAKEGIGSPAQAAQIALLAWQNGDIAVAQFAAKIATNYSISKLIAGQDGDANSISWTDLGKLAKGKSAIGRDDIGAAPDLTEALESDLRAMAGLAAGASSQNQWDPYGTTAAGVGGQPPMPGQVGQPPMPGGMPQGQPASLNGVNGNVYMMPYAQAQQLQLSQQGQILQPQQLANLTPLQQSMQLAGVGANLSPLMQQAGLASPGTFQQQQPSVAIPAAISQPISSGNMLQQQPPVGYPQQQPMAPAYPQQGGVQPQYPQQQMASMPLSLPGSYRLALIPTF